MKKKPTTYEEKIKKIVDDIMNEKNDNPRDSAFRFLQKYHPEAQHISLRYPGKFVKLLGTETFTINNRTRSMDGAELVNPDKTLPYQSTINPEQQTTPVRPEKKDALYDYKLQLTIKHKKPSFNVIVTNIGDEDHEEIFESHGDAFKVFFRVINDKEITEILNTLNDNIKNEKELTEIEALSFGHILIFARKTRQKHTPKRFQNFSKKPKTWISTCRQTSITS